MSPEPQTCQPLVVHIDDNAGDLELVQTAVEDCCGPLADYRGVNDGEQALKVLATLAQPGSPAISLILVDLNIPRVNGWEIVRFIQSKPILLHVPLVMLSGSQSSRDIEQAQKTGVVFRTKPTTFTGLSRLVCEFLKGGDWKAQA